jgi:hypothetical protein
MKLNPRNRDSPYTTLFIEPISCVMGHTRKEAVVSTLPQNSPIAFEETQTFCTHSKFQFTIGPHLFRLFRSWFYRINVCPDSAMQWLERGRTALESVFFQFRNNLLGKNLKDVILHNSVFFFFRSCHSHQVNNAYR